MKRRSLTRRDLLRAAGSAAGGLTFGAGARATTGPEHAASGRRLTQEAPPLSVAAQAFGHDALRPVLDAWTQKTGIAVDLVSGPSSGQQLITQAAAGQLVADVVSVADDAGPLLARQGWLEPLDDAIPAETWNDFPPALQSQMDQWHNYDGKRYRVPHEFSVSATFYRKDLFDSIGLAPPASWEEVVTVGQQFLGQALPMPTLDALKDPGTVYVYVSYLAVQAGGNVFAFDEATLEALQFAHDLIAVHDVMPRLAFDTDSFRQNQEYMSDQVAFMRQWPFFWDVARANTAWYQEGKGQTAIALPPAGRAGRQSWWGGSGFGVPSGGQNKGGALDLLAHLVSPQQAPALAAGNSWFLVPRTSVMEAASQGALPTDRAELAVALNAYVEQGVLAPRPFDEAFIGDFAEAERRIGVVAQQYLTDQIALSDVPSIGGDLLDQLRESQRQAD